MLINNEFHSPNFSKRVEQIEFVILHFTEMTFEGALSKLCDIKSEVSAHYLIKEDGTIFQLVDDENIAWHAGRSSWFGKDKLNQNSIGIEIDNLGKGEFSKAQMHSCIELCKNLSVKYNLSKENFLGHSDIAPERKIDPGVFFNWKLLYEQGLGIWHGIAPNPLTKILYEFGSQEKDISNIQTKLKNLGYNIEITGIFDQQTNNVIRAFQSKFCPHIIRDLGLEHYSNMNSKYSWDTYSNNALNILAKNK